MTLIDISRFDKKKKGKKAKLNRQRLTAFLSLSACEHREELYNIQTTYPGLV